MNELCHTNGKLSLITQDTIPTGQLPEADVFDDKKPHYYNFKF
jgi:hypothetical protein